MPEIVQHCPLCGNPTSQPFDRRMFLGQEVSNRICRNCGLVYQSPRMSAAEMQTFYAREYRQVYQGQEGPNPKDLATQADRAQSLLGFAGGRISRLARHLDIGCSAGLLLQAFQQAYDCQAVGVEPGDAYREYARANGLAVYPSLEALQADASHSRPAFDLISMAHVLEHLPEPVQYLARLRQDWLAPDGRLLLEVPNLYAHDSFEVAHLVSYSAHTLTETLRQAGFEVLALEQHGRPRSNAIPLYLTVLAGPAAQASGRPTPESGVSRKRQWGLLRRSLITRLQPKRAWLPTRHGNE